MRAGPLVIMVVLVALIAHAPSTAHAARVPVAVGIGDQSPAIFAQPAFGAMRLKRLRYVIGWDVTRRPKLLASARAYVQIARASGYDVLVHVTTVNYVASTRLPTDDQYRRAVRAIAAELVPLGVREFGVWNEANHFSEPTARLPQRAAALFTVMYSEVRARCPRCLIVALDILGDASAPRYARRFFAALTPLWRARARIIGIHNYPEIHGGLTRTARRPAPSVPAPGAAPSITNGGPVARYASTASLIAQLRRYVRPRVWLTESGVIVSYPYGGIACDRRRPARLMPRVFSLARANARRGLERMYLYNWTGTRCTDNFDAGLTNHDGTLRSGYPVVRRLLGGFAR